MSLIISSGGPKDIQLNGTAVKEVWFDGKKVWPVIQNYVITGTIFGKGKRATENCGGGNRQCQDGSGSLSINCQCDNCQREHDDYTYKIQLTFAGVDKLPIKYVSKSGATVIINQSELTGSGTTYTYTSDYLQNDKTDESFGEDEGINTVKSLYPESGVPGYSVISSINIEVKDEGVGQSSDIPKDCDCSSDCSNCGDDCLGDMGDCDCADCDMDCGLD